VFDAVAPEIVARPLRHVQVKGREQDFMIYELLGFADSHDPELGVRLDDRKLSELTWLASKSFQSGDLARAARGYQEILTQFPNDPVAKSMLTECFPSIVPAPPRHSAK
jgi:adenylate cyclase